MQPKKDWQSSSRQHAARDPRSQTPVRDFDVLSFRVLRRDYVNVLTCAARRHTSYRRTVRAHPYHDWRSGDVVNPEPLAPSPTSRGDEGEMLVPAFGVLSRGKSAPNCPVVVPERGFTSLLLRTASSATGRSARWNSRQYGNAVSVKRGGESTRARSASHAIFTRTIPRRSPFLVEVFAMREPVRWRGR